MSDTKEEVGDIIEDMGKLEKYEIYFKKSHEELGRSIKHNYSSYSLTSSERASVEESMMSIIMLIVNKVVECGGCVPFSERELKSLEYYSPTAKANMYLGVLINSCIPRMTIFLPDDQVEHVAKVSEHIDRLVLVKK